MKRKPGALLSLPRHPGKPREKSAQLSCYAYQKDELRKRARRKGVTVSRYLNELLWKEWVE